MWIIIHNLNMDDINSINGVEEALYKKFEDDDTVVEDLSVGMEKIVLMLH